ncbi:MAG: DEAD/DEAH box helicase [Bacteroidales bacterium]|nr:DEAD/DEAH box helicase [Bacteroidales bacterium]
MQKFIVGIRQHPVFGYIAVPLIVGECQEEFCRVIRSVVFQDIIDSPKEYNDLQKEIVTISDNYSDEKIYAYFNKNKKNSITDYLATLDEKTIDDVIRPYIEKHIAHLLKLLTTNDTEIYYKPYRYEHIYKSDKITINPTHADVVFNFERNEEGIKYHLTVTFNGKEISIFKKKPIILLNKPAYVELEHILMSFEKIDGKKLLPFYTRQHVEVPKSMEKKYFENFILKTVRDHQVRAKGFEIINLEPQKKAMLHIESDWLGEYAIIPKFSYNGKNFNIDHKLKNFVELDEHTFNITKFSRNLEWEKEKIEFLKKSGLIQKDNFFKIDNPKYSKEKQKSETINWLNENYDKLEDFGFEIIQRFSSKKYFVKEVSLDFKVETKIDWFDIKATVHFGEIEMPFYKLREYILNNRREIELPNGEIAVIPDAWFKKYKNILKFAKKTKKDNMVLSKFHYFALLETENFANNSFDTDKLEKFFESPEKNGVKIPKSLLTKLRDYQNVGYSWLNKLRENNFGGCLADDMGLGKTVQILSAILKQLEDNNQINDQKIISEKPSKSRLLNLVIVPRSLLHNWLNEVKKNTPAINTLLYAGNDRERFLKKLDEVDLIITSYGIARNDLEVFLKYEFNYIVLDESQYIKNPNSKTYQSIKLLNGKNKVVLTGTPIENSLRDLWTQLNFVNKGILGSFSFFRENFISPIERTNNEETKEELKKIIAPFILRRTKEEVVKDLPEIEEQTVICEMTEEQATLYEEEKSKVRNKIIEFYQQGTLKQSSVYVLQALTKLRQIANHPKMVEAENVSSSGKFDEVFSRLETLLNNNHKVLIFSSFVKYLKIFEKEFKKKKLKYLMLTGESTKRQEIIDEFQDNDDIKLFLISIKAGGVGINLTAADYVFVLDPWWNPAVERQAIARAHRIGQTKNVFAFKFITFGTVEEKINKLQQKKLELAHEFIDANNYFKYFSEDVIVDLFN